MELKPVNLQALADAFESIADDDTYRGFVDKRDGQIHWFDARHLAIAGFYLDGDDYEVYPAEQSEIDKAQAFTDRYDREFVVSFPDKYELQDYDIMEEYAEAQPDPKIANQLLSAIQGKGAFRKFRETVTRLGFLEDWYKYRDNAVLERARRWCVNNDIDYGPKESQDDFPLGTYRHYKGNLYEVLGFAKHSETLEDMVIYKALYGEGGTWVRPLSMWDNPIEVDGKTVERFEYIDENDQQRRD